MKSQLTRIDLEDIDFRLAVLASLLLASKVSSIDLPLEALSTAIVEVLFTSYYGPEAGSVEKLVLCKNLAAQSPEAELFVLSALEFRLPAISSNSVEHLLYLMRYVGWKGPILNDAVAFLNDISLLQQSRCFMEKHLAATAVLLALGRGEYNSPCVSWWRLFGIAWEDLMIVVSLIVPDLFLFHKIPSKLKMSQVRLFPLAKKTIHHFDDDDDALSGSEEVEEGSPVRTNHFKLFPTDEFRLRDNRFISFTEVGSAEPSGFKGLSLFPIEDSAEGKNQNEAIEKTEKNSEVWPNPFGVKVLSDRSFLSRSELSPTKSQISPQKFKSFALIPTQIDEEDN